MKRKKSIFLCLLLLSLGSILFFFYSVFKHKKFSFSSFPSERSFGRLTVRPSIVLTSLASFPSFAFFFLFFA